MKRAPARARTSADCNGNNISCCSSSIITPVAASVAAVNAARFSMFTGTTILRLSAIWAPDWLCSVVATSITPASTSFCWFPSTMLAIARRNENLPPCGWCRRPCRRFMSSCSSISRLISAIRTWLAPNSSFSSVVNRRFSPLAVSRIVFERVESCFFSSFNSVILFSLAITFKCLMIFQYLSNTLPNFHCFGGQIPLLPVPYHAYTPKSYYMRHCTQEQCRIDSLS